MEQEIKDRLIKLGFLVDEYPIDNIFDRWKEPFRYYHGMNHLLDIIKRLKDNGEWDNDILFLAAVFHDIRYFPLRTNNEIKSVEYYKDRMGLMFDENDEVCNIIMDTKDGANEFTSELSEHFIKDYDRYNLYHGSFIEILNNTKLLFKEEQFIDLNSWKQNQIYFLKNYIDINPNIQNVIEYIKDWEPKIGVYAGSFNPFHKGHYNILLKAEKVFDKVVLAFGKNPTKDENELFDIPYVLKNSREIIYFDGFLTTFMDSLGYDTTLVRGLRNSTDLQYEMTQFQYLQDMKPDIKIVNIFCDKEYEHISSSAIRNLKKLDEETIKKYLI